MKVLMIGPARSVKGGISAVVNNYYRLGLDNMVELQYLATMEDQLQQLVEYYNALLCEQYHLQ